MIEESKYESLLNAGLVLDHYFLLCNIKNGIKPINNKRIQGFINLLSKKGYIEDDKLTPKGDLLVDTCVVESKQKFNFSEWVVILHKKCQDKLIELTGKKQVLAKIKGKEYSFLESHRTLNLKLARVITLYKLSDYDKIETTILKYIEKCQSSGNWFPLLHYFILKDNISPMVTAMENEEEDIPSTTSTQKFL